MIDFAALSLRDYILIAATLVGGYLLLSLVPLLRSGRKQRKPDARARHDDGLASGPWPPVEPKLSGAAQRREPRQVAPAMAGIDDAAVGAVPPGFARDLAYSSQELEIRRMRRDMEAMRLELTGIGEELRQLKATRNVAPIYSEAMTLAQHGEAPAGIAAQCGISIGEAELVAALARKGTEAGFDDEDDDRYSGVGR